MLERPTCCHRQVEGRTALGLFAGMLAGALILIVISRLWRSPSDMPVRPPPSHLKLFEAVYEKKDLFQGDEKPLDFSFFSESVTESCVGSSQAHGENTLF